MTPRLAVAVFGLLCLTSVFAADTEGTSFQALFFRNQHSANGSRLYLDFVNNGDTRVLVDLEYYTWDGDYSTNTKPMYKYLSIDPHHVETHDFTEPFVTVIYSTIGPGLNIYPDLRIRIKATSKISVYATNLDVNKNNNLVGDTYLVLPDRMAGSNYVVSLPDAAVSSNPSDLWQMKVIYFLPVDQDVNITIDQYTGQNTDPSTINFAVHAKPKSDLQYFAQLTGLGNSLFRISGTGRFLILVGDTCAPEQSSQNCDFAAFMPPPTVDVNYCSDHSDCAIQDVHVTYSQQDKYFLTAPASCDSEVSYAVTDEVNSIQNLSFTPNKFNDAQKVPIAGRFVEYKTHRALLQMTRIGDHSSSGGGLYLDIVPSTSQYLTESTSFYVRDTSTITLIMNQLAQASLTIDGKAPKVKPGNKGKVGDWYVLTERVDQGLHQIGIVQGVVYSIEVQTAFDDAGYTLGFVPAYNKQKAPVSDTCSPPTTPPPPPITTPIPITTTSNGNNNSTSTPATTTPVTTTIGIVTPTVPITVSITPETPTTPNVTPITTATTTVPKSEGKQGGSASQLSVTSVLALFAAALAFLNM